MKLLPFLIGLTLLAGCGSQPVMQSEPTVLVTLKPAQVTRALCTETGAMLHYRNGEGIPAFLLVNADKIYRHEGATSLAFIHSKCDYSQHVTKTVSSSVEMTVEEFTFRYDHDQVFRDSIESYRFQ